MSLFTMNEIQNFSTLNKEWSYQKKYISTQLFRKRENL